MYAVELLPRAVRELKKLTPQIKKDIIIGLESLKETPLPAGCKKLKGVSEKILKTLNCTALYRIKCDKYRIIYTIKEEKITIVIVKIGARKDIYNFLK